MTTAQPQQLSLHDAAVIAGQHLEQGRLDQASAIAQQVLSQDPDHAAALHVAALVLRAQGQHAIALALLEKSVLIDGGNANSQFNLAVQYALLNRKDQALTRYRAALSLNPKHVGAIYSMGQLYADNDQPELAEPFFEKCVQLEPNNYVYWLSLSLLYFSQRKIAQADRAFDGALKVDPTNRHVQWEASHWALLKGDFVNGWKWYEARLPLGDQCKVWVYPFPYPLWQGQDLRGKHILIHGEQGLGDEIMFLSFVPELLAQGVQVSIAGQPHLNPLWKDAFPQCKSFVQLRANESAWTKQPVDWLPQLGEVDYQIAFGSMAQYLRPSLQSFLPPRRYIQAAPEKIADWQLWLDEHLGPSHSHNPHAKLRVGVVWAANPSLHDQVAGKRAKKKSVTAGLLTQLGEVEGVEWISLQAWDAARQVDELVKSYSRFTPLDCSARLTDFAQTAALVECLDLIITVDTSVAHLCGAMGRPTWVMLPYNGDWRWGLEGTENEQCYWYEDVRLFRQPSEIDWATVVQQVATELNALVVQKRVAA